VGTTLNYHPSMGMESGLEQIITPHSLLPSQYADMCRSLTGGPVVGEKGLMFEILSDALDCLKYRDAERRKLRKMYHEALAWITLPNSDGALVSFDAVCEALGIDAEYLRRGILDAMRQGTLERVSRRTPPILGQRPTANRERTRHDRRRAAAEYA